MISVLLAVVIWGSMFLVVKDAVDRMPVLTFLSLRFWLAGAIFLPSIVAELRNGPSRRRLLSKGSVKPAVFAASFLLVAFTVQGLGIKDSNVAYAAILSSTYVIYTPVLALTVLGRRPSTNEWTGGVLALLGVMLLTRYGAAFALKPTLLLLACAAMFACQIIAVAGRDRKVSSSVFTGLQMIIMAFGLTVLSLIVDGGVQVQSATNRPALLAIVYAALAGSALAFWLQTRGQARITPTQTAVLYTLEPVVAIVLAAILRGETTDTATVAGGSAIVLGVFLSMMPNRQKAVVDVE